MKIRSPFLITSAFLLTTVSCRSAQFDEKSSGATKSKSTQGTSASNSTKGTTADLSKELLMDGPSSDVVKPVPRGADGNVSAPVTLTSGSQITRIKCFTRIAGADVDHYGSTLVIDGSGNSNGNLTVDIPGNNNATTHATLSYNGTISGLLNFSGALPSASMTLQVASSSQSSHGLYAGTSIITTVPGNAATTSQLTCDVNGQFRINPKAAPRAFQAKN